MRRAKKVNWFYVLLLTMLPLGGGIAFIYYWLNTRSLLYNPRYYFGKYKKYKPYRKIIFAQAAHETGDFKSRLFIEQKNAFGMRCAKVRPTLNIQCLNNYATFKNLGESLEDLFLWHEYNQTPTNLSLEAYVSWIKSKGYFEDTTENYLKGMQFWYSKI